MQPLSFLLPLLEDLKDLLRILEENHDLIPAERQEAFKDSLRKIEGCFLASSEEDIKKIDQKATCLLEELGSLKNQIEKQLIGLSTTKKGLSQYTKIKETIRRQTSCLR